MFVGTAHEQSERKSWAVVVLCSAIMLVDIVAGNLRLRAHRLLEIAAPCIVMKLASKSGAHVERPSENLPNKKGDADASNRLFLTRLIHGSCRPILDLLPSLLYRGRQLVHVLEEKRKRPDLLIA